MIRRRIETASMGYYPNPGLTIELDGEDWVILDTAPDPDAIWRINTITRVASPLSVIAILRPATAEESEQSAKDQAEDVKTLVAR